VKRSRPEAVSVALREIFPNDQYEATAARFFTWLQTEKIAPQWILYEQEDIQRFRNYCAGGLIPDEIIHGLNETFKCQRVRRPRKTAKPKLALVSVRVWRGRGQTHGKGHRIEWALPPGIFCE